MSDTEEEVDQETMVIYTCKRCPGHPKFDTEAKREAHRVWHRKERQGRLKTRPSPKSSKKRPPAVRRLRDSSVTPSSTGASLFSVLYSPITPAPATTDITPLARQDRAARKHILEGSYNYSRRYPGN